MTAAGVSDLAELLCQSHVEHDSSQGSLMQPGLPGLEAERQVKHASVITQFEEELNDDPEYACCSCEHLHQWKAVPSMKNSCQIFTSPIWQQL